ncbi:oxidoreductase [Actinoplanes cyaneus]|uniref:Oxidoreductase n=1 Tax=Actinoplanes cyaneus TaxID=52696 RepID=A0A919IZQ3_9ACTN|nr:FAD-dependent oxidoreductase [Actinoplanes cyaneus]MCW2144324.1 Glycine/D-amino acid oxidase (deaminating) [Actinoplanes cyaneus]GID71080.1 oxidoreductase [Actinoplanes cyaneus]
MGDTFDVAVVGAGVIALAVAEQLLTAGLTVAVVGEASGLHPGHGSRAAGAMLSTFSEIEAGHDPQRVKVETGERLAAHDAYPAWLDRLASPGHRPELTSGTWVLAAANRAGDLTPIQAAAAAAGHNVEQHPGTQIPGLRAPAGSQALWLPTEARIDSGLLMNALTAAVRRHPNATWYDTTAVAVSPGCVRCTDATEIRAGRIVLAAGVQTAALLPGHGCRIGVPPILAGRGVSMLLHAPQVSVPHVVRTPNAAFACGTHLMPRHDGSLYLGATNRLSVDPDLGQNATLDEIAVLATDAARHLDPRLTTAQLKQHRVGYRPYTADHLPLIGRTSEPSLLLATATYRCGILLAPRLAALLADEILHPGALDEHPYRVLRPMPAPDLPAVLDTGASTALIEHLIQAGAVLPPHVAAQLAAFTDVMLREAAGQATAAGHALRRLWGIAPVVESVPALFELPARLTGGAR